MLGQRGWTTRNFMKKLLILLLVLAPAFLRAAESDLNAGIDLTGQTSVTTSQLLQLVNSGTINTNGKGGIIRKATRPDVTTYPRYTNWLWLSIASDPPTLKSYVPTGDSDTNWIAATIGSASIAAGNLQTASVTAGKIAANAVATSNILDNAITDAKITAGAVTSSKIANGSVSNAHIASATITGDRISTLTITDTNIAAATITAGKLVTGTITSNQIAESTITTNKISASGTVDQVLVTDSVTGTSTLWRSINLVSKYVTNGITVPTTAVATTNSHTLGFMPQIMRVVMVCNSAELGYSASDEVPIENFITETSENPVAAYSCSSSQWFLSPAGTVNWQVRGKQTASFTNITKSNWRIRVYLILFTGP